MTSASIYPGRISTLIGVLLWIVLSSGNERPAVRMEKPARIISQWTANLGFIPLPYGLDAVFV